MKVLVINSGSSSLKYQLMDTTADSVITKGLIEKIGGKAEYTFVIQSGEKKKAVVKADNHSEALEIVLQNLQGRNGFIKSLDEIDAVGHRVVHGGENFSASALIDHKVIKAIEDCADLAPLHNPPNLQGILACRQVMPDKPQVAVFDTAFHQTMPPESYMYALPYEFYEKYGVRKYGFHGTSHRYVSMKAAEMLSKPLEECNLITCHMGNGSSFAAIRGGKVVNTTMGFTPLDGLVMGTRCGTIDPAVVCFLMDKENLSTDEITNIMNKKSGLLGVSGISNDLREVKAAANDGNTRAALAYDLLIKSVRNYIGSYMIELGRVDAIIFTAGIGENDFATRKEAVKGLEMLGVDLDEEKNHGLCGEEAVISTADSRVKIMVVPTNEELMIALDTEEVVSKEG